MKKSIYCLIGTLVVACFCLVNDVFALEEQNEVDVQFTFNPMITLTVSDNLTINDLMPGSSADSNIITVGVSTNNLNGYYLSTTAGTSSTNTRLNNTVSGAYFASLADNVPSMSSAGDNTWGYSYSTDNGTSWISGNIDNPQSGYNGLPLDNDDNGATGVALADTATFVNSQSIKFKIAAKAASSQTAGTYTNTINFYAVAYPEPEPEPELCNPSGTTIGTGTSTDILCMQDFSASNAASVKNSMVPNQQYQLTDSRDNNVYTITKINGVCWMSTNLNLGDSVPMDLTPQDTNISSNYTLPASSLSGFSDSSIPNVYKSGSSTCGDGQPCYTYYNYNALTAGTTQVDEHVAYDICPKGWRLPLSSEYEDLIEEYPSSTALINSPFKGVYAGIIDFSEHYHGGEIALYWTSTAYSQYSAAYLLQETDEDSVSIGSMYYDAYEGGSARCVTAN